MGELVQFIFSLDVIFSLDDKIGSSIVRLILLLFGIGILNYLFHTWRIRFTERKNFKRAQTYFKTNQVPGDVSELAGLRKAKIPIRSIIYRRIKDLVQIKQNGGQIDNDALADILAGEASRKASFSNYILGILIILGLIGTLRGLITAIVEVQPLLEDIQDLDQLPTISDALRQTLAGMNTAFVTTLAGLLTSLVLGFFGWLFNRESSAFLTDFERFISTEILPRFTQTPESSIESSVALLTKYVEAFKIATEENVQTMHKAIQLLTDTSWGGQLEQQYVLAINFGETSKNLLNSLEKIGEHQVLVKDVVTDFKKLTESSTSKMTEYQGALQKGLENAVPELTQALKSVIRDSQDAQQASIDALAQILQAKLQSFTEERLTMMEKISEHQVFVKDAVTDFKKLTESSTSKMIEYQGALQKGLENAVPELTQALKEGLENAVPVLTKESQELKSVIRDSQNAQQASIDALAQILQAKLQSFTEERLTMIEKLDKLADGLDIRSSLETTFGEIKTHQENQKKLVDEQRELIQILVTSLQQLQKGFPNTSIDRQQDTEKMLHQISLNFADFNKKMDILNQTMSQPGLYRWGAEIRRWFRSFRKQP